MTDGAIKAVRIQYFNKETWASEGEAGDYVAGFLGDESMGVFGFQIWSQQVGRPEIECVVEFSDAYLETLRREGKPFRREGKLVIWNTEACFRDASGRWLYVTAFNYFLGFHPRGDRGLSRPNKVGGVGLPVGKWSVEFANQVVETCAIRADGTASVVEARRSSDGRASAEGGSFIVRFADDRIEKWTPVGKRMVVEHRFPGAGAPVLGIAERVE